MEQEPPQKIAPEDDRDLYSGLIRLHILHHAAREPIFGAGIMEELARYGYRLSAGTLYPLLHSLEHKGYLASTTEHFGKRPRRVYRINGDRNLRFGISERKSSRTFRRTV